MLKPGDLRHGVALEVLEQHHDLEEVRALLGHARIDTTQVYTAIRPPQVKRAVAFYEESAGRIPATWWQRPDAVRQGDVQEPA